MKMQIQKRCSLCNQVKVIEVDPQKYDLWMSGMHIQDAMPELSEDDRELLISGICGTCFDELFSEDDEEEDTEYEGERWNDL